MRGQPAWAGRMACRSGGTGWNSVCWGRSSSGLARRIQPAHALLPIPRGKQRTLLAALLAHAGEVIPADELAELLWEGGPPLSARVTLQNYVKRLRQALGPAGQARLRTHRPGLGITAASAAGPARMDLRQARAALTELARAHLIEEKAPGRFVLYELLRAYAVERAGAETAISA